MNFQPYLIANYSTGLDREVQPWLLPDDAQFELYDGYVYRGVWQKREGYSQFATGQRGGAPYCESRMVHAINGEVFSTGNGVTLVFNNTLSSVPVRRGTVVFGYVIGGNPFFASDNGLGVISGTNIDNTQSTIDYTTGAVQLTFTLPPDNLAPVYVNFDAHQGLPVMGVMTYYTQTNTRQLIVADTTYVNRYNTTTNRLDDISPTTLLTGDKFNFFSWVNYATPNNLQRLLFVNNKDPIQQYTGTTVTPYHVYINSIPVSTTPSGVVGDGTVGPYTINTPANTGILPGSLVITDTVGGQTVKDDQFGNLTGNGSGTVDYLNGKIVVTFTVAVGVGNAIDIAYTQLNTPINTCLHLFSFKDRLVLLYTTESGTPFGLRIRISGTGAFSDVFTNDAIGAGVIDIPDQAFIFSADFNRDNLLIFTRLSTWSLNYTGSDSVPFALDKIDDTRGSEAPYGTITYLNRTNSLSPLGFVITDGYSVVRSDDKLPDYPYNNIDQNNFALCFAGSVDIDRDHYLIHPSNGSEVSDQILVTNYEEDNFSVYRIPLSSMGTYVQSFDVTWNDLSIYSSWDEMATDYKNWSAFAYSKGSPLSIGGGHQGQIVKLNDLETEDYPIRIYNITVVDSTTIRVTTDYQQFLPGALIQLEGVQGMTEVNNKQYELLRRVDDYTFDLSVLNGNALSSYTNGGVAAQVIVFDCKTKKFNPFANANKKVSCGWIYFYVSTQGTDLTANQNIIGATQTNPCVITVPGHNYSTGTQVYIDKVQGMTEINGSYYFITVIDHDNFSLDGIDATGYGAYTSSGYSSSSSDAILNVYAITNDQNQSTAVGSFNPSPYQVNLTTQQAENGEKKWYKLWINQTARFIQFQLVNNQAGAVVQIHAMMPGFQPVGYLV